jgi:hypothetical protein
MAESPDKRERYGMGDIQVGAGHECVKTPEPFLFPEVGLSRR